MSSCTSLLTSTAGGLRSRRERKAHGASGFAGVASGRVQTFGERKGPALLFENVKGYLFRVAANVLSRRLGQARPAHAFYGALGRLSDADEVTAERIVMGREALTWGAVLMAAGWPLYVIARRLSARAVPATATA